MSNTSFLEKTRQLLENAPIAGHDPDTKVRHLPEAEYLRRFAQYRRADLLLTRKYQMTFDEFISQRIVREKEYSWDSESDAMEWETATSGMETMERHLKELKKSTSHIIYNLTNDT